MMPQSEIALAALFFKMIWLLWCQNSDSQLIYFYMCKELHIIVKTLQCQALHRYFTYHHGYIAACDVINFSSFTTNHGIVTQRNPGQTLEYIYSLAMTFVISPCTQRRLMCLASAKYDIRSAHYTLLYYMVCTCLLTLHTYPSCNFKLITSQYLI